MNNFFVSIFCKIRHCLVILTQTVGQMTEHIPSSTIATQTPYPRANLFFDALAYNPIMDGNFKYSDAQLYTNMLRLRAQFEELMTIDGKSRDGSMPDTNGDRQIDGDARQYDLNDENAKYTDERPRSSGNSSKMVRLY